MVFHRLGDDQLIGWPWWVPEFGRFGTFLCLTMEEFELIAEKELWRADVPEGLAYVRNEW